MAVAIDELVSAPNPAQPAEDRVRQIVEVGGHPGRRGEAAHHQEQRQRADLAVGQKVLDRGGEGAERRIEPDEQRRADEACESHPGGKRHQPEHEQPKAQKGVEDLDADVALRPVRYVLEVKGDIDGERERRNPGGEGDLREYPMRRLSGPGTGMRDRPAELVEHDDELHERAESEKCRHGVGEGRHRQAEHHRGAPLRGELAGI